MLQMSHTLLSELRTYPGRVVQDCHGLSWDPLFLKIFPSPSPSLSQESPLQSWTYTKILEGCNALLAHCAVYMRGGGAQPLILTDWYKITPVNC